MAEGFRVHVIPHSHIDTEWYWTREVSARFGTRAIGAALELMRRDPGSRFCQDQVTIMEDGIQNLGEKDVEFLGEMVTLGHFEIVGGMYVQPEVAEPHGESLVRQITLGKRWFRERLGVDVKCAWNIDTFGQCTQLPQILKKSGYRWFVFSRGVPPRRATGLRSEFYYRSPDGSRILTHWMPGHYCGGSDNVGVLLTILRQHSSTGIILLPWGCDITCPGDESASVERIVRLAAEDLDMDIEWAGESTPTGFFEEIESREPDLDVAEDDFNPPLNPDLRGTYDNRIELKKINRRAEYLMMGTQNLATLRWLEDGAYPGEIDSLWQSLIYNHFHDIIGGSHHDAVYRSAIGRLDGVVRKCIALGREAAVALGGIGNGEEAVTVFNPLGFPRTEVCEIDGRDGSFYLLDESKKVPTRLRGNRTRFVAQDIPAFGYKSYSVGSGNDDPPRELSSRAIENEYLRVEVDTETGCLDRVVQKVDGWEVLSGPGNRLVATEEEHPDLEGPLSLSDRNNSVEDFPSPRIEAYSDGMGSWLEVDGTFAGCRRLQRVMLYDGIPRVDFETSLLDYRGGNLFIDVRFPLNIDWGHADSYYETPFAVTRRPIGEHFAAQTFVDVSDSDHGASLINRGTPGYWVRNSSMDMVLLRSFSEYWGYQKGREALGLEIGSDSKCPLARERGDHHYQYSLYPHPGGWRGSGAIAMAHSFNSAPICITGTRPVAREMSYLSSSPGNFELTSMYPSGGYLVIRGYETSGEDSTVRIRLPFRPEDAWLTDLMEDAMEVLEVKREIIEFHAGPHSIVTLLIKPP